MASKRKSKNDGMSRGKFLSFLGKIGILSLIPGIPALAGKGDKPQGEGPQPMRCGDLNCEQHTPLSGGERKPRFRRRIEGPKIKGRTLSDEALYGSLASPELERLRSIVTGKYYEKVGERFAGKYIDTSHIDDPSSGIIDCVVATTHIPVDMLGNGGVLGGLEGLIGSIVQGHCQGKGCSSGMGCSGDGGFVCDDMWCSGFDCGGNTCWDLDCSGDDFGCKGDQCNGHKKKDMWQDLGNFTEDIFVQEVTDIFNTTDIAVLKEELLNIIVSEENLRLNVQHFINGASTMR